MSLCEMSHMISVFMQKVIYTYWIHYAKCHLCSMSLRKMSHMLIAIMQNVTLLYVIMQRVTYEQCHYAKCQ
jgi:hypothetical protein